MYNICEFLALSLMTSKGEYNRNKTPKVGLIQLLYTSWMIIFVQINHIIRQKVIALVNCICGLEVFVTNNWELGRSVILKKGFWLVNSIESCRNFQLLRPGNSPEHPQVFLSPFRALTSVLMPGLCFGPSKLLTVDLNPVNLFP